MLAAYCAELSDTEALQAKRCMHELVPHLRRAFDYYRRDQNGAASLSSGRGLSDALSVGIVRLGRGGRVQSANEAATRLFERSGSIFVDSTGRFRCSSPRVMDFIASVLGIWADPNAPSAARSFLVPRGDDLLPLRVTVLAPKRDAERAFFIGPECILLIEDAKLDTDAAAEEMRALYHLTPAEERIVAGLAAGLSVEAIAARAGVTQGTVRVQMKSVFAKSGLHRQVDLVRQACALAGSLAASGRDG